MGLEGALPLRQRQRRSQHWPTSAPQDPWLKAPRCGRWSRRIPRTMRWDRTQGLRGHSAHRHADPPVLRVFPRAEPARRGGTAKAPRSTAEGWCDQVNRPPRGHTRCRAGSRNPADRGRVVGSPAHPAHRRAHGRRWCPRRPASTRSMAPRHHHLPRPLAVPDHLHCPAPTSRSRPAPPTRQAARSPGPSSAPTRPPPANGAAR